MCKNAPDSHNQWAIYAHIKRNARLKTKHIYIYVYLCGEGAQSSPLCTTRRVAFLACSDPLGSLKSYGKRPPFDPTWPGVEVTHGEGSQGTPQWDEWSSFLLNHTRSTDFLLMWTADVVRKWFGPAFLDPCLQVLTCAILLLLWSENVVTLEEAFRR